MHLKKQKKHSVKVRLWSFICGDGNSVDGYQHSCMTITVRLYFHIAMEFRLEGFVVLTFIYKLHIGTLGAVQMPWSLLYACTQMLYALTPDVKHLTLMEFHLWNGFTFKLTVAICCKSACRLQYHLCRHPTFRMVSITYDRICKARVTVYTSWESISVYLSVCLPDLSVFHWSASYWLSVAIVASLLRCQMLNSSSS